jgi:hypothetical protein
VQRQKPFDAADDADALFNEILAFAFDALRVLLFDTWNVHVSCHLKIS